MAKRKDEKPDMFYQILEGFFKGIWYLVSLPFKGLGGTSARQQELERTKAAYREQWAQLESMLHDPVHQRQAIMQADIMLDKALQIYQVPGTSLGERLKASTGRMDKDALNLAWAAHKVRNRLAHELQYNLTETEARATMNNFRSVLRTLGVL